MKAEAIAKKIKLVCLDVDGVLTDGSIIISGQGELFKQFYVRDGLRNSGCHLHRQTVRHRH